VTKLIWKIGIIEKKTSVASAEQFVDARFDSAIGPVAEDLLSNAGPTRFGLI